MPASLPLPLLVALFLLALALVYRSGRPRSGPRGPRRSRRAAFLR
jgi:hypothetical protein